MPDGHELGVHRQGVGLGTARSNLLDKINADP